MLLLGDRREEAEKAITLFLADFTVELDQEQQYAASFYPVILKLHTCLSSALVLQIKEYGGVV